MFQNLPSAKEAASSVKQSRNARAVAQAGFITSQIQRAIQERQTSITLEDSEEFEPGVLVGLRAKGYKITSDQDDITISWQAQS